MIDNQKANIPRWSTGKKVGDQHKKSADRKQAKADQKKATTPLFPEIKSPNPKVDPYKSPQVKDRFDKATILSQPLTRKSTSIKQSKAKSKMQNDFRSNISSTISTSSQHSYTSSQICSHHHKPQKPQDSLICGMPLVIESLMEVSELDQSNCEEGKEVEREDERKNFLEMSPRKIISKDRSQPSFERWKKGNMIGSGSTSEVYRILDQTTGVIAAGKNIAVFPNDDPQYTKNIKSQLEIMCKLDHPNIVKFYKYIELPNQIWFFMQYLPQTLQTIYSNYGKIPANTARQYSKQLLSAIKCLHENKIIHKDIKCSNILLSADGIAKLGDFGSSKRFDLSTSANLAGTFKGSVRWMAPEVIKENHYGRKSDIWSFGCTVLEMVTGTVPWIDKQYDNPVTAIFDIGQSQDIPLIPQDLPTSLREFLKICLIRDPEKRASIEQLQQSKYFNE